MRKNQENCTFSNWLLIGTYKQRMERGRQLMNPKADEEQMYRAFCLLGEHDAPRISYIYSHMDEYDFRAVRFLSLIF